MLVFYLFALVVVWLGLESLRGGFRYLSFVRGEVQRERPAFTPFASILAPCRGLDQGLEENLAALFRQDYPAYEIIFVTDNPDDPSRAVIEALRAKFIDLSHVSVRLVLAGAATTCGQKVHNLCAGLEQVDPRSTVLAFVDSDARVHTSWLRSLVAPLNDQGDKGSEGVGATTGYRWFIPVRGGFASHLRSVWNASIASALGANVEKNFCWGGSSAIRRETFYRINVLEHWRGALSDDFTLMRALRRAKLPIHFVPDCLTPSFEDCGLRELIEFSTRQLKITRVYAEPFWRAVLAGSLLFVSVFFGGVFLTITRAVFGLTYFVPLLFVTVIFALGAAKAYVRLKAVELSMPTYGAELRRTLAAHVLLWPFASALYLYNALAALLSRRIKWRGIVYELKSPTETVIIDRPHGR